MAYPTYVNKGTFAHQATGTPLNVGVPSGWAQDDILVITFLHANPGSAVPSGWTRMGSEQDFGVRSLSVFVKRATASEGTVGLTLTGGGSVGNSCAQMEAYRGCKTTGNGWEADTSGQDSTVEVAFSSQSLTTLGPDRLVHVSGGQAGDIGGQRWSNWAGTNLSNVTERVDDGFTDGTGGSIATAHGEKATAGSCGPMTADKDGSRADANVIFALIPSTLPASLTADAVLLATQSASFTADAVLLTTRSASFTADAVIDSGASTVEVSFTGDAVLLATQSTSFTADAVIQASRSASLTGDAVLLAGQSTSLSADAVLFATLNASLTGDAVLSASQSASFTADAAMAIGVEASFTADAVLFATVGTSLTADAVLLKTQSSSLTADAELIVGLTETSFTADAILLAERSALLSADAVLLASQSISLIADSILLASRAASLTADAILVASQSSSVTADAVLLRERAASFSTDSILSVAQSASLTADAWLVTSVSTSFTADAFVQYSFTADAVIATPVAFTADAVIVKASRFYLSATLAAAVSPGFESGWESTGSAQRRMMGNPSLASSTKTDLGVAETSTSGTFDVLIYQFVSEPLAYASVICGPVGGYIRSTESNIAADDRSQMVVKVVSGDGSTLRGTVIDFDASALTDEWPTTSASRRFPLAFAGSGTKGTPVSASAGDRVVVEVGYRAHNTSSTSRTGTLRAGHTVGGSDFTTTGTTTDLNPWIEISATTRLLPSDSSLTANAILNKVQSRSLSADAYILPPYVIQHARTGPHTGVDRTANHYNAWLYDRYLRGQNLHDVLADIDARLTARESGYSLQFKRMYLDAVFRVGRAASFTADAFYKIVNTTSFTANAVLQLGFFTRSWIVDPTIYISDSIAGAVDWGISTATKGAFINTASLTSEAGDPEDFWGETDKTGWAKFTLSSTQTVRVSTDYTEYDSVILLYGPGSPTDANFIDSADDSDYPAGDESLYYASESITMELAAGTYYVEVMPYDPTDIDFNITLTMQIV